MRTVDWHDGGVRLIDQRLLPNEVKFPVYRDVHALGKSVV